MHKVQARNQSDLSKISEIARSFNPVLVFSHLRPATLVLLGVLLMISSAAAIERINSASQSEGFNSENSVSDLEHTSLSATAEALSDDTGINPKVDGTSEQAESSATISDTDSGTNTNITIETKSQTSVQGQTSQDSQVTINGNSVDLPDSGRYSQDIRDENSRTRIKANIDSNNAKINISTKNSYESD